MSVISCYCFYIPIKKDLDEEVERDPSLLDGFLEDKQEEAEPEMEKNHSSSVEIVTIRRPDGVRLNKEKSLMFLCLQSIEKRETVKDSDGNEEVNKKLKYISSFLSLGDSHNNGS